MGVCAAHVPRAEVPLLRRLERRVEAGHARVRHGRAPSHRVALALVRRAEQSTPENRGVEPVPRVPEDRWRARVAVGNAARARALVVVGEGRAEREQQEQAGDRRAAEAPAQAGQLPAHLRARRPTAQRRRPHRHPATMDGTATLAQRTRGHEVWAHLVLVLIVPLLVLHSYSATGPTFGLGVDLLEALGDTSPEPERLRGGSRAGSGAGRGDHSRATGHGLQRRGTALVPGVAASDGAARPDTNLPNCLLSY